MEHWMDDTRCQLGKYLTYLTYEYLTETNNPLPDRPVLLKILTVCEHASAKALTGVSPTRNHQ